MSSEHPDLNFRQVPMPLLQCYNEAGEIVTSPWFLMLAEAGRNMQTPMRDLLPRLPAPGTVHDWKPVGEEEEMRCMSETVGATKEPSASITIESVMETVEQMRKQFPDMDKCQHPRLITSKWLPPSEHGMRAVCASCFRSLVIPEHLIVTREAAERLSLISISDDGRKP